jgi:hypothetical protein
MVYFSWQETMTRGLGVLTLMPSELCKVGQGTLAIGLDLDWLRPVLNHCPL